MNPNQPLEVKIKDGLLSISIGIETLAYAANESDLFNPFDDKKGDWVRRFQINDSVGWAKDVARAMQDEAEDGSTPLTRFLDKMDEAALNDGAEGVEYIDDLP